MRAMLIFLLVPCFLFAQAYFEASGQTVAFTLTAGAKAAWNSTVKTELRSILQAQPSLSAYPNPSRGSVCLQMKGNRTGALVTIYNVQGKKIQTLDFAKRNTVTISTGLGNGLYFARLIINGHTVQTTRFLVVR